MDNAAQGQVHRDANEVVSSFCGQRYAADYRYADPVVASDAA